MSVLDKSEKKVLIVTGTVLSLFVFSILYAKSKYDQDVVECVPFDKTYTEAKVTQLDEKTYQVFSMAQAARKVPSVISAKLSQPSFLLISFFR